MLNNLKGKLQKSGQQKPQLKTGAFEFFGTRKISAARLCEQLAPLGFASLQETENSLEVTMVQGEDIGGEPHLFFRYCFGKSSIKCEYSIPEGASPQKRKMECTRGLFDILCTSDFFQPQPQGFFAALSGTLSEGCELIGEDLTRLSNTCSKLEEENAALRQKCSLLLASSEKNERAAREESLRCASLSSRITQLEGHSLQTLSEELYDWIRAHGGMLDVREFSRQHNVSAARVEEGIDYLLKVGYIGRKRD